MRWIADIKRDENDEVSRICCCALKWWMSLILLWLRIILMWKKSIWMRIFDNIIMIYLHHKFHLLSHNFFAFLFYSARVGKSVNSDWNDDDMDNASDEIDFWLIFWVCWGMNDGEFFINSWNSICKFECKDIFIVE